MFREILEELNSVLKGKTLDAILPPLLFVLVQSRTSLLNAVIFAIVLSLLIGFYRLSKRQGIGYAFGGLVTVLIASGFALFANNASNYYLPGILSTSLLFVVTLVSVLIDKPLAAFVSHLTRGWTLAWFWREDIKPAYREVTWFWVVMFGLSAGVQWLFYLGDDLNALVWVTSLFGLPFTIFVLVVTYVYGLWRLKNLGGPGIDEFSQNKSAPFKGQTRGF
ncbi:MAG TPA: hypothetical protein DIC19_03030 [Erysipelotrichaceae bacterium]|nr:hypothetical protein [Erysipelotrichaceae bacterium]